MKPWPAAFATWWMALLTVNALGLVWLVVRRQRPERRDATWLGVFTALLVLPWALGQWEWWMPAVWAAEGSAVAAAWWLKHRH